MRSIGDGAPSTKSVQSVPRTRSHSQRHDDKVCIADCYESFIAAPGEEVWTRFSKKFDTSCIRFENKTCGDELRELLGSDACPEHFRIAKLTTRVDGGVVRLAATTRSEYKPPFKGDAVKQPYLVIDVNVDDIFETVPNVSYDIGSCTVFVNSIDSVTSTHQDQESAMFFMLTGRKVFRCLEGVRSRRPVIPLFDPVSQPCPPGWFDVVVLPGDVLFVPPRRWHCVFSEKGSVGVSVTLRRKAIAERALDEYQPLLLQPSQQLDTQMLLKATNAVEEQLDSMVDLNEPSSSSESSPQIVDGEDTVNRDIENVGFGNADDPSERDPTRPPRDVEEEAEMAEESDLDMIRSCLSRKDRSLMSKVMANWNHEGVSRVTVVRSTDAMTRTCDAIRSALFEDRCVPKTSIVDSNMFEKVFGRKMPDNDNDLAVQSSRVMMGFDGLGEDVVVNVRQVQHVVTEHVRQLFKLGLRHRIDVVTTKLLIRGTGRVEAQQEHLDGLLEHAGNSVTVSCILALTRQRGTLFHNFADGKNFPTGTNCCPLLECGDFVIFDPDKCVHQGHLNKDALEGHLTTPAIFFLIQCANFSGPLKYTPNTADVTNFPYTVLQFYMPHPSLRRCCCCFRGIYNWLNFDMLRSCRECVDDITNGFSTQSFICDVCTKYPVESSDLNELGHLANQLPRPSTLQYIASCAFERVDDVPGGNTTLVPRMCCHPCDYWTSVPTGHRILLFFKLEELILTAQWLIRVHTSVNLICRRQQTDIELTEVVRGLRGHCPRASMLACIGLRWIGVSRALLLTDEEEMDTLYFKVPCPASAERVFLRVRQLHNFAQNPTAEMLDLWEAAMGATYDYERACHQSAGTPTIQCKCVTEGCGTGLFAGTFGWSVDEDEGQWLTFAARMAIHGQ